MRAVKRGGLLAVLLLAGCNTEPLGAADAAPADAAAPVDVAFALACHEPAPEIDAGFCDTSKFSGPGGPRSIQVGALCDDVAVCGVDEALACAIEAAAPRFRCRPAAGAWGCSSGLDCVAYPGTIDAEELEAFCRVAALPIPGLTCHIEL
jgi:hypothetical protein